MSYYRLDYFGNNDHADKIIVNPGYKVIVYNDVGYSSTSQTIDNTWGTNNQLVNLSNTNAISSVRLYYGSTELIGSLSSSSITEYNPVASSDAPTTGTNKIVPYTLKGSTIPAFCPVYMTGAYASYPIFCSLEGNWANHGMNESDNHYLVAPHFTIIVWPDPNLSGTAYKYENATDDWKIFLVPSSFENKGSSNRLYYYGTLIPNETSG